MRPRRPDFQPCHFYHIYNRGAHRELIFKEPENYRFVLQRMAEYARSLQISLIAYCLMPTHFHYLVLQLGDAPAGLFPQRVYNSYTKAFNRRYGHSGTLFEGNYKVIEVDSERYLMQLCRYIHANPVKDGLVARPEDWPYSNYQEWVGLRSGSLVDREFVRANFPKPAEYSEFVWTYLRERKLPKALVTYLREWGA